MLEDRRRALERACDEPAADELTVDREREASAGQERYRDAHDRDPAVLRPDAAAREGRGLEAVLLGRGDAHDGVLGRLVVVDRAQRDAGAERLDDRAARVDDDRRVVPVGVLRERAAVAERLAEADELARPLVPVRENEVTRSRRAVPDLESVAGVLVAARAVAGRDLLVLAE